MKIVDWSYHRPSCGTCKKTQDFFAAKGVQVKEEINAKKNRLGNRDVLDLIHQVVWLYVARGKGFVEIDLNENRPSDEALLKLMIGPTGNLRAPAFRVGKKLVVGFNEEMYQRIG